MMYPDRVGEAYSLYADNAQKHSWHYFPQMVKEEAVVFKVYDKN